MDDSYRNSKYNIWFYNLSLEEKNILKIYLPKQHFEIVDIENNPDKFKGIEKLNLLDKPDIVICDENTLLNKEFKQILFNSYSSLAKVTFANNDTSCSNIFELTNEPIQVISKVNGNYIQKNITKLENSINKIIEMAQLSNIEKLQQITDVKSKEMVTKEPEDNISKEYLFKFVGKINEYINFKDNYTAGHCERVATYAEAIGIALNMDNESLEDLILAAYLHDIGKIALPDAVIKKTSGLDDLEYNIMKKHVELGPDILPNNEFGYLKSAIRGHHEKYDGTGYPDGLKGDDIPLFAQILAVADSFDAMTSQRSYNKVKSAEEAFDDLKRHTKPVGIEDGQGMFYNPLLVDKFINIMRQSKTVMDILDKNKKQADERTKQGIEKQLKNNYNQSEIDGGKKYA